MPPTPDWHPSLDVPAVRSGASTPADLETSNSNALAAFASLHDPTTRAYYDRKRAQGKKHNATLICLARRRFDVLHAMLKNGTLYQPRPTAQAA